ncbi:hypothetical protein FC15_GL000094 [Lapidilactobacillus concavus DSM 17758]|uniref:Uncharacterized protein n=1 Tax=Lapidilactobacillus concavus DSM 17758 TaxID=1423735 RepID=A0A0R1W566_9LACO|nr:hypothetical protein FC15_GL000094 [Lapidilactobacillus concavus DSM 17758]
MFSPVDNLLMSFIFSSKATIIRVPWQGHHQWRDSNHETFAIEKRLTISQLNAALLVFFD